MQGKQSIKKAQIKLKFEWHEAKKQLVKPVQSHSSISQFHKNPDLVLLEPHNSKLLLIRSRILRVMIVADLNIESRRKDIV